MLLADARRESVCVDCELIRIQIKEPAMHVNEWLQQGLGLRIEEGHGVGNADIAGARSFRALPATSLYRPADLSKLSFSTTADLEPIHGLIGQTRPLKALRFGTQANKTGFNLFVIGPQGAQCALECRPAERFG
jgi:hypothetical protein